ncbi:C4-dicarboxylate transporter DcuC [Campylobacter sp. Cr9]|uniref:C4-dicarboxylate transporter DcuC n=1 Tax=Campylobacter sp. Cr9 TaxID=2735728 RepID=UPI003015827D|nr:C4-dicarboxylate transporter DcuC [Campylobacter sp. Cr9]
MIMYISAILGVSLIIYMLIKNLDIKISLFFVGLTLMYIAMYSGGDIAIKGFKSSGIALLDPLQAIAIKFKDILTKAGFVILILGGYTAYMNKIRANDATVSLLIKPIKYIKSPYILVPVVFLLGNLLSIVVPSASNLAIILLATLYPIMKKSGLSTLSAAGIIATTATIVPTPLGSDNIAVVGELVKLERFANLSVSEYVFNYHARVSIPTIIFMAFVHLFWQKYCDSKEKISSDDNVKSEELKELEFSPITKIIYAFLPLLPIFLLVGVYLFSSAAISVEIAVFFSFIVAIVCELIRTRNIRLSLDLTQEFFKGMGGALSIVALLVAGTTFVVGLQSIGIIKALESFMSSIQGDGISFVLPLILVLLTAVIVILSGSGNALFYAMAPLFVPLAAAANIDVLAISIPMGLAGNLLRAVSPVSAVIMIVAGSVGKTPLEVVKRTSVPMIAGTIFMFVLSMIFYM